MISNTFSKQREKAHPLQLSCEHIMLIPTARAHLSITNGSGLTRAFSPYVVLWGFDHSSKSYIASKIYSAKNSRPVGFYSRNSTKSTVNPNTTVNEHYHHGGAVRPSFGVESMDPPDRTHLPSSEGVGRGGGRSKLLKSLNYLSYKIKTSLVYEIQCGGFDGDFDDHAAGKIQREAHRLMERIGGFMLSPFIAPSGVCSRRIGPAGAMVIAVAVAVPKHNTKHNFLLALIVLFATVIIG